MNLIQDKLDVADKKRSNLFNWRGQFTPEFVEYVLESFAHADDVVDPFSGSGTVLLECARGKQNCFGYEINPAAYAMSRFFTFCNIPLEVRLGIISNLEMKIQKLVSQYVSSPLSINGYTTGRIIRSRYGSLEQFAAVLFSGLESSQEKIIALDTIFIAHDIRSDSSIQSVIKSVNYIKGNLMRLPYTERTINSNLGDARLLHKNCPANANIIFTSPPYINVFNYHQNYRTILEALGWDMLTVAESEFGSNRKNRINRFKTVIEYCLDMEQTLKSFWSTLADDGLVILVVGRESTIRGVTFHNSRIVSDIAKEIGCFKNVGTSERKFTNKFGENLKEDILFLRKDSAPPSLSKAKEVSLRHLTIALNGAPEEVRSDIQDAINSIEGVDSSPLFAMKGDFLNA